MSAQPQEEHEDRSTYYGGHDPAALAGDNKWARPIDVYSRRLRLLPPKEPNESMLWGLRTENAILDEMCSQLEIKGQRQVFKRDKKQPYYGGTADLIEGKIGGDAKNVRYDSGEWGEQGTAEVPKVVLWQAHHYLELFDCQVWYIGALFSGQTFRMYQIDRDQEMGELIREMLRDFETNHVAKQIPPDIDYAPAWKDVLAKKYPNHGGAIREATTAELNVIESYRNALREQKLVEKNIAMYENQIRDFIAADAGISTKDGAITWKTQKGATRLDTKLLKDEMPEIAEKYSKAGEPVRVFRKHFKDGEAGE